MYVYEWLYLSLLRGCGTKQCSGFWVRRKRSVDVGRRRAFNSVHSIQLLVQPLYYTCDTNTKAGAGEGETWLNGQCYHVVLEQG